MISEESWEMLKKDALDKKIFLIKESENMFIFGKCYYFVKK